MTRAGRYNRELVEECTAASGYENLFAALFADSARVEGIEDRTGFLTDDVIIKTLYYYGAVAYDKLTGLWLPFTGEGVPNAYGVYDAVRLWSPFNGINQRRARSDVFIFDANPSAFPIAFFIKQRAKTIAEFDGAISQNLDAIKEMTVILAGDKVTAQQLTKADQKRRRGGSVAVINRDQKNPTSYGELSTLTTGATYKVDALIADRRKVFEDTLHIVGVRTPTEKGERLITSEVETQNEETNAYISLMINTFNAQAIAQGAPFRLVSKNITAANEKALEDAKKGVENGEEV